MYHFVQMILLLDSIPDRAVDLFASYIGPAVLLVVGALLTVVGLMVQEEKPIQAVRPKGHKPGPIQATQRANLLEIIHDANVPRWLRYSLIFMGLMLLVVGISWVVVLFIHQPETGLVSTATLTPATPATMTEIPTASATHPNIPTATATYASIPTPTETSTIPTSTPAPANQSPGLAGVALASLKYQVGGNDSRQVDLRHAAIDGIQVRAGESLVLYDLWVSIPESTIGLNANFELLANGEQIGQTEDLTLQAGGALFDVIKPAKYTYMGVENGFKIQADWERLELIFSIHSGGKEIQNVVTPIVLNKTGNAWYITPPYAHLVSFVYSVDDHPRLVADLSNVMENGLAVSSGSKFTIQEIWYKTDNTLNDRSLQVEVYPSSGNNDVLQLQTSSWTTFKMGINNLLQEDHPFEWENISAEKKWLVVTLTRNDKAILDRYIIPLKAGSGAGLIPIDEAIRWPFESFTYVDFESPTNLNNWYPLGRNFISQSTSQAFSGDSSLAVTIKSSNEQGWMEWDRAFMADFLIGQVFWPDQPGISISWAQVCEPTSGGCVPIPLRMNEWNTFIIQFSQWKFKDKNMSQIEIPYLYFQGSINGIGDSTYTFFIDGIQLYSSHPDP